MLPHIFQTFSEDCQRRLRKIRRCFNHTLTNLSVIKGTKENCYQKGMIKLSSRVKDKNSIFIARNEDMICLVKGEILVFHWCLYNNN